MFMLTQTNTATELRLPPPRPEESPALYLILGEMSTFLDLPKLFGPFFRSYALAPPKMHASPVAPWRTEVLIGPFLGFHIIWRKVVALGVRMFVEVIKGVWCFRSTGPCCHAICTRVGLKLDCISAFFALALNQQAVVRTPEGAWKA